MSVTAMVCAMALGCGDDDPAGSGGSGGDAATGGNPTGAAGGGMTNCAVPTGAAALDAFLQAGSYQSWPSESAPHDSAGPHFGNVRVYLDAALDASLQAGASVHPRCATAIKELYGSGTSVLGWSVALKLADDSAGGDNWYWYEEYQGTTYADGAGESLCTGCHASGADFVRSAFPLQ
jgi:hypothetical protein